MAGPVRELVKSGSIISRRVLESILWGKMDAVAASVIKGVVALIVFYSSTRIRQNSLTSLYCLKWGPLRWLVFRNSVNLLGVEDGVHAVYQPLAVFLGWRLAAILIRSSVFLV